MSSFFYVPSNDKQLIAITLIFPFPKQNGGEQVEEGGKMAGEGEEGIEEEEKTALNHIAIR